MEVAQVAQAGRVLPVQVSLLIGPFPALLLSYHVRLILDDRPFPEHRGLGLRVRGAARRARGDFLVLAPVLLGLLVNRKPPVLLLLRLLFMLRYVVVVDAARAVLVLVVPAESPLGVVGDHAGPVAPLQVNLVLVLQLELFHHGIVPVEQLGVVGDPWIQGQIPGPVLPQFVPDQSVHGHVQEPSVVEALGHGLLHHALAEALPGNVILVLIAGGLVQVDAQGLGLFVGLAVGQVGLDSLLLHGGAVGVA